jgi:hypothetical protein
MPSFGRALPFDASRVGGCDGDEVCFVNDVDSSFCLLLSLSFRLSLFPGSFLLVVGGSVNFAGQLTRIGTFFVLFASGSGVSIGVWSERP